MNELFFNEIWKPVHRFNSNRVNITLGSITGIKFFTTLIQNHFFLRYCLGMKKLTIFLALVLAVNTLNAQDLNGVWLATDNQLENLATINNHEKGAVILDFNQGVIGNMSSITNGSSLDLNRKKTKIKVSGIKGKLKVISIDKDRLVLKGAKGITANFKKLDLTHKIDFGQKELNNFLIEQHCGIIQGLKGRFTTERFFLDKPEQNMYKRKQYINFTDKKNGYWYFRKIRGNAFLVFTIDQKSPENIFQVLSIRLKGFDLLQLQSDDRIKNLSLLETCL